ncbi:MAG: methyltransferase [Alphaproteobacteria bacterium]|nr:methyltransferase [Alphaproteobacteria bacterium]
MSRELSRQRARRTETGIKQRPWRRVVNPYPPIEVLSADEVEAIHLASLRVLEELGIEFLSDGALDRLEAAGADVTRATRMVRFDRGLVAETVGRAPAMFTLHARNPERNVTMGANHIVFGSVGGPPNVTDLDRGRRPGNFADFNDFIRVIHSLNAIHMVGGIAVAPIDLSAESRHLDCCQTFLILSDRVWHATGLGRQRPADAIAMVCIAHGIDRDRLYREPAILTTINANSPRRYDGPMLDGLETMAEAGQCVCVTPFTLAGAMSPTTIAGSLVQQNAEALAGIAYVQIVNPGNPVLYGGFTSNVDMKTGAPAFGTPEYTKACLAGGQMARRYRLPYRSSNVNASNLVDAQAAYESEMALWGAVMGHANLIHHGAGWLEGGLTASFEKLVIDAEMLQMMAAFCDRIEVTEATLAVDAIAEVPPGGHFFGAAHTMARYETAFYAPIVSDWRNFETWREGGELSATQRANLIWKELLRTYEPPPMDGAVAAELAAYVARRKREIDGP